jgi:APA family basic amino acid/polyamine antiporter
MGSLFGGSIETVFSLFISFALFSSLSAFIILGPRVYFSMAKDGYFFKSISEIHPRFLVPAKSLLLQAAISVIMVLSGTFDQVLTYMGFSLGIFPIVAILGVFRLAPSERTKRLLPGYPVVPLVYVLAGLLILILAFFERPTESSIALLTVLIGIPVFFLFKRRYHDTMLPQSH